MPAKKQVVFKYPLTISDDKFCVIGRETGILYILIWHNPKCVYREWLCHQHGLYLENVN